VSQANGIFIKKASKRVVFVEGEYAVTRKASCVSHCPCPEKKRQEYSDIQKQLSGKVSPIIFFVILTISVKKPNMVFANSVLWSRIFQ